MSHAHARAHAEASGGVFLTRAEWEEMRTRLASMEAQLSAAVEERDALARDLEALAAAQGRYGGSPPSAFRRAMERLRRRDDEATSGKESQGRASS